MLSIVTICIILLRTSLPVAYTVYTFCGVALYVHSAVNIKNYPTSTNASLKSLCG